MARQNLRRERTIRRACMGALQGDRGGDDGWGEASPPSRTRSRRSRIAGTARPTFFAAGNRLPFNGNGFCASGKPLSIV